VPLTPTHMEDSPNCLDRGCRSRETTQTAILSIANSGRSARITHQCKIFGTQDWHHSKERVLFPPTHMDDGPKNPDRGRRAPKKRNFCHSHDYSRNELQLLFRDCVLFDTQFLYQSKAWKSGFRIKSGGSPKIWTAELKSWFLKNGEKSPFTFFSMLFLCGTR
jgi:hypothetical protein